MEFIERRSLQHTNQMIGHVRGEFDFNRQNLLKSIGRSAQEVVDSYDREAEALKLAKDVQRAILQTAAVEAGAIGLGAILVVILNTTFLDVTGVLGASALAALGLYVLPYRRQKVKAQLRARIGDLRRRLDTAISHQFDSELKASVQRIREAVAPYTRFVRVEREKLETLAAELQRAEGEWRGVAAQCGGAGREPNSPALMTPSISLLPLEASLHADALQRVYELSPAYWAMYHLAQAPAGQSGARLGSDRGRAGSYGAGDCRRE